jgi:hypothetical protein
VTSPVWVPAPITLTETRQSFFFFDIHFPDHLTRCRGNAATDYISSSSFPNSYPSALHFPLLLKSYTSTFVPRPSRGSLPRRSLLARETTRICHNVRPLSVTDIQARPTYDIRIYPFALSLPAFKRLAVLAHCSAAVVQRPRNAALLLESRPNGLTLESKQSKAERHAHGARRGRPRGPGRASS